MSSRRAVITYPLFWKDLVSLSARKAKDVTREEGIPIETKVQCTADISTNPKKRESLGASCQLHDSNFLNMEEGNITSQTGDREGEEYSRKEHISQGHEISDMSVPTGLPNTVCGTVRNPNLLVQEKCAERYPDIEEMSNSKEMNLQEEF